MAVSRLTQTTLQNGFEKFNRIWDERSAVGSMEPISAITLSAAQATVEFNNIPGTYSHLQLRAFARDTGGSGTYNAFKLQFNGDTSTSNYAFHMLYGNGAAAGTDATATGTFGFIYLDTYPNSGAIADNFSGGILDIVDYASTNKNKTIRWLGGHDNNGTGSTDSRKGFINLKSGLWLNSSSAITSVRLSAEGTAFAQYSSFSLYGIK